jgi:DNA-nicking Smr family endonuclease
MSRRRLSDDERTLWKGVTRSIAPLRKSHPGEDEDDVPPPAPKPRLKPSAKTATKPAPIAAPRAAAPKPAAPPPLAPLGRRMKKRVARGSHAIDGRLDLHGMTQAEAHDALLGYLRRMQHRGGRLVLVITGKGAGGDGHGGRGVLKRMVPLWLGLPEFRGFIVGFESASIGHGGEGALYVSLRRPRTEQD